jgi:hypothetical protein
VAVLIVIGIGSLFGRGDRYEGKDISSRPTISVSGEGEEFMKPDIATVSFGVTQEAPVVGDAQDASAKKTNAILAALKTAGIADKDIKTVSYNIYPRYEYQKAVNSWDQSGKRTLAGYSVSQSFEVKIRVLTDAGKILSSLGELGATDVSGLSFGIDDEQKVIAAARAKAVADAKAKAERLAADLGVRLVGVIGFSEGGYYPPVRYAMMADSAMMSKEAAVPQMPAGENRITSNVTITYEIR